MCIRDSHEQKTIEHRVAQRTVKRDRLDAVSYTHLDVYKRQAPTFAEGSITAKTADGFSIGGYNTPVELGTVYRFKYKNVRASGWYDGFYLGFKAANIYWLDGGVQVDFNDDSTAIHFYNGNEMVHQKAQSPSIESGKEYEIEFGLLKAGDDTVKVHLTINGLSLIHI